MWCALLSVRLIPRPAYRLGIFPASLTSELRVNSSLGPLHDVGCVRRLLTIVNSFMLPKISNLRIPSHFDQCVSSIFVNTTTGDLVVQDSTLTPLYIFRTSVWLNVAWSVNRAYEIAATLVDPPHINNYSIQAVKKLHQRNLFPKVPRSHRYEVFCTDMGLLHRIGCVA